MSKEKICDIIKKKMSGVSRGPDILEHNQMPKKKRKKDSILTARGADHDEPYSYLGGPNESQRVLEREE